LWQKPQLLGVLDDRSRLCCHLQWYLDETAEALIHGLSQAFHKRGLPRALLTDNGAAMIAAETVEGLEPRGSGEIRPNEIASKPAKGRRGGTGKISTRELRRLTSRRGGFGSCGART
jgi:transposase InsO family protein